jgi:gas vesicle protein
MTSGKVILSLLLAGAAIGAAVRILFESQKGKVKRRFGSKKGEAYASELEETFNGFFNSIAEKLETMKQEAIHLAKTAKIKPEESEMEVTITRK